MIKILIKLIKNILPYGLIRPLIDKKNKKKFLSLSIPSSEEPEIFNSDGQKLRTFFLKDEMYRDQPYCFVKGRFPKYINWDRYNYGLDIHFYTHHYINETIGNPNKKFAFLIESESIVPNHYKKLLSDPSITSDYVKVFTHSERLLNKLPNAAFLPGAGVWYGTTNSGGVITLDNFNQKNKNISLVSSNKSLCDLHDFRIETALHLKINQLADTFGTFDGGNLIKVADSLTNYRYSVIIENHISDYWFTEKIMNCFASLTIPIYFGASKISEFFNPKGIVFLQTKNISELDSILHSCTLEYYENCKDAIIDNYNRVQRYLCIEDYLYTQYSDLF